MEFVMFYLYLLDVCACVCLCVFVCVSVCLYVYVRVCVFVYECITLQELILPSQHAGSGIYPGCHTWESVPLLSHWATSMAIARWVKHVILWFELWLIFFITFCTYLFYFPLLSSPLCLFIPHILLPSFFSLSFLLLPF